MNHMTAAEQFEAAEKIKDLTAQRDALLAACKSVAVFPSPYGHGRCTLCDSDECCDDECPMRQIRAAIEKAEGKV